VATPSRKYPKALRHFWRATMVKHLDVYWYR
jgi:hypothetical protein